MRPFVLAVIFMLALGCDSKKEMILGKWYTYAENGDYMELWVGEDKALAYLAGIDQFMLYDLEREGDHLSFSLIDSRVVESHQFELIVTKKSVEIMQGIFISESRIDSLKTYFLISEETPNLASTLSGNRHNIQELLAGREGSHDGHGH